jgi:Spy/CpxP family protein refolding chaperone
MKIAWAQVGAAVALGAVLGAAAAPGLMFRAWERGRAEERMLDRFSRELRLSDEQRGQVAAILESKRQRIDALRAEIRPKFQDIHASASAEIRAILTPDQQPAFDAIEARHNAQRERWRRYKAHRRDS